MCFHRIVAGIAAAALICALPAAASDSKQLQRLKGIIGYQPASDARFTAVFGRFDLPDDYLAVTQQKSAAMLVLPDSSIVALGEETRVVVGSFNQTADGPGSTITVNGGALRFDVRRPAGGHANYKFVTPTTQIAVRGTVGLLSLVAGNTIVACLACAADSIAVTVGSQTIGLAAGQFLAVSAAGAVVSGAVTSSVLGTFSSAGVSTTAASGPAAATAGVSAGASGAASGAAGGAATGAASAGATAGVTAGATAAVAAGVTAAVIKSSAASPAPAPTAAFSVSGVVRRPASGQGAPAPTPSPQPAAVRPGPAPGGARPITR